MITDREMEMRTMSAVEEIVVILRGFVGEKNAKDAKAKTEEHYEVPEASITGGLSLNDTTRYCSCGEMFGTRIFLELHIAHSEHPTHGSRGNYRLTEASND